MHYGQIKKVISMKPKDSLENLTRVDEQPLNSGHDTGDHDESPMQQWQ